ncbi:MAG: hypothetical protein APF81_27345 [Desulfosporosinus sp. BRH_c37]|nr:MAG: hypothetical protein APF81_27345 [Desulfosporosinus sp. BRH_c37]
MDIRCKICGFVKDIAPTHKDFKSANKNLSFLYICEHCSLKIQLELQKANDIYKFSSYPHNPPRHNND